MLVLNKLSLHFTRQVIAVVSQVKVKRGNHERLQAYEGVVIAKRNRGLNSAFIVRKISAGEGVERTFQTYSPLVESIEVKRRVTSRRAIVLFARDRSGKSARIKEKLVRKVCASLSTKLLFLIAKSLMNSMRLFFFLNQFQNISRRQATKSHS